ncbi:dihydrofolate reductase [Haloferula helveola]|uniref:Dihydrofolate reductase n=1 Tax=Haloferula helveola TaxID=490095 RepID=A0ABM7RMP1_9BACT|nr:dihydrofolate reductase [Haloferula helveola]
MKLIGIVAMTADRIIGRDGALPWHLPEDLAFFKRTTSGHPIVMGRATYDSIGRPLPKRRNIVITRNREWSADGVEAIGSPESLSGLDLTGEVFIIGGAKVYEAFLPHLDELLVSRVREDYTGDTRFPEFTHRFGAPELLESHEAFDVYRYRRN